ncbi:DUF6427 family protein [Tenacibaculum haliotis]|uniref:DUF6427 family protein n=1 Tax=Tenacibaculum haliotis TaxID=1888914 RepID=UPI0021AF0426|nr:DUF6427 family protein [Tenacibaculum haliotis]MCT4700132.1 DUF6427 family protein [Tenacibaculum haliotis]
MLANFFGKSKPVNFIVLFALFLSYFFISSLSKELSFNLFKELLGFVVLFAVFNFIIAKNQLTFDNSFAFLFFVILIGFFTDVIAINKTFYACLTVLLFLRKVYSLQSSKNAFHKLFDGGLWLGISFLIEPYTALFGALLYVSIYLHHHFTYQTLLIPVIGFGSVIFLFFTYCFWYDKIADFYLLFDWNFAYNTELYLNINYILPIIFMAIFVFFSIILKSPKALAVLNTFRKNWILVVVHFVISVFIVLLINDKTGSELLFLFFPTAIILANGLELFQKKWISDAILFLLLIGSVLIKLI